MDNNMPAFWMILWSLYSDHDKLWSINLCTWKSFELLVTINGKKAGLEQNGKMVRSFEIGASENRSVQATTKTCFAGKRKAGLSPPVSGTHASGVRSFGCYKRRISELARSTFTPLDWLWKSISTITYNISIIWNHIHPCPLIMIYFFHTILILNILIVK